MPELCPFDYAVIRVVPRVEREEFINAGVIVSCPSKKFLKAGIELDKERLAALDPSLNPATIQKHLDAIPLICEGGAQAGPIGLLSARSRFHWLVAPRSTIIQTSPVHTGLCDDTDAILEQLLDKMVRSREPAKEESGLERNLNFAGAARAVKIQGSLQGEFSTAEDEDAAANAAPPSGEAQMTEREVDENLMGTFPASDPPSWTLGSDHRSDTKQEDSSGDVKED